VAEVVNISDPRINNPGQSVFVTARLDDGAVEQQHSRHTTEGRCSCCRYADWLIPEEEGDDQNSATRSNLEKSEVKSRCATQSSENRATRSETALSEENSAARSKLDLKSSRVKESKEHRAARYQNSAARYKLEKDAFVTGLPILGAENSAARFKSENPASDNTAPFSENEPQPESRRVIQTEVAEVFVGKKYKPVAQKVRPVLEPLPAKFRIERNIIGDPLTNLIPLNPHLPEYVPVGYTQERKDKVDELHNDGFLNETETKLMHHMICIHEKTVA
jgi:hypothetical protein